MDAIAQYMTGQMRPHHAELLADFQRRSDAAAASPSAMLDIPYGSHPRESFDFFHGDEPWRGTLAFFHAGYWQSRDKSQFRFLAPAFLAHGIDVALVNYPLCPDVSLPALTAGIRASVPAVLAQAASLGRGGDALVASGHSAGAHIAVELALTEWREAGLPHSPIAGVVALSGVFDLEPLLATPLNDKLRLDVATARACSPVHRVRAGMPPALFIVGGTETDAFVTQNADMHAAWEKAGNAGTALVVDGADHFTLLEALRQGDLLARVLAVFGRGQAAA